MLVATPGQTTSYPLIGKASQKICHTSNASSVTANNIINSGSNNNKTASHQYFNKLSETTKSGAAKTATTTLMKTFSVRINRGTEFIKDTVQKAFVSTMSTANDAPSSTATCTKSSVIASNASTNKKKEIPSTPASPDPEPEITEEFVKKYTVPPTAFHRFPDIRSSASSTNSLSKELCHFKPIRIAPTSIPKSGSKSRGYRLKRPIPHRLILPQTQQANPNCDSDDTEGIEGDANDKNYDSSSESSFETSAFVQLKSGIIRSVLRHNRKVALARRAGGGRIKKKTKVPPIRTIRKPQSKAKRGRQNERSTKKNCLVKTTASLSKIKNNVKVGHKNTPTQIKQKTKQAKDLKVKTNINTPKKLKQKQQRTIKRTQKKISKQPKNRTRTISPAANKLSKIVGIESMNVKREKISKESKGIVKLTARQTPPLTRARLRSMPNEKLKSALAYGRHRKN